MSIPYEMCSQMRELPCKAFMTLHGDGSKRYLHLVSPDLTHADIAHIVSIAPKGHYPPGPFVIRTITVGVFSLTEHPQEHWMADDGRGVLVIEGSLHKMGSDIDKLLGEAHL